MTPDRDHVDVWQFALDLPDGEVAKLRELLSPDERARAERLRVHPERFVVGRARLRQILGRVRDEEPARLSFHYGEHAKPAIEGGPSFNLAHSGALALLAVTAERAVGVDVEQVRAEVQVEQMARRFSAEEQAALVALPPERRREIFFVCWTRKEAYLKARGGGISLGLAHFDALGGLGRGALAGWTVCDLPVPAGFAGAVAVEGVGVEVRRQAGL